MPYDTLLIKKGDKICGKMLKNVKFFLCVIEAVDL